ncbi:hypothetical protein EVAR_84928_1 [Eumeta japonica]|uniref:Uncharacterized protein n=1 Tax=Eumeta variegata TaxID=151549 RepID=A0A4C1VHV1_EUMVA|nr:hypothetical protein EVAR_84928_1 [Eumeta japonica]
MMELILYPDGQRRGQKQEHISDYDSAIGSLKVAKKYKMNYSLEIPVDPAEISIQIVILTGIHCNFLLLTLRDKSIWDRLPFIALLPPLLFNRLSVTIILHHRRVYLLHTCATLAKSNIGKWVYEDLERNPQRKLNKGAHEEEKETVTSTKSEFTGRALKEGGKSKHLKFQFRNCENVDKEIYLYSTKIISEASLRRNRFIGRRRAKNKRRRDLIFFFGSVANQTMMELAVGSAAPAPRPPPRRDQNQQTEQFHLTGRSGFCIKK